MISRFKKLNKNNHTHILNELTNSNASTEKLSLKSGNGVADELSRLVYMPAKIYSGVEMMAAGIILSCVPGTVVNLVTNEVGDETGSSIKLVSIDYKSRKPHIPFHYEGIKQVSDFNKKTFEETSLKGNKYKPNLSIIDSGNSAEFNYFDSFKQPTFFKLTEKTVTGYELASVGANRILAGALGDPCHALLFTAKKLVKKSTGTEIKNSKVRP